MDKSVSSQTPILHQNDTDCKIIFTAMINDWGEKNAWQLTTRSGIILLIIFNPIIDADVMQGYNWTQGISSYEQSVFIHHKLLISAA